MKCLGVQLSVACQKIHSKVKNMFLYFEILTSKKLHGEHIKYGDSTCNMWCISLTYLLRS